MAKRNALAKALKIEPFRIGCYEFHSTGIDVHGRPTFGEHQGVGDYIQRCVKAGEWWMADWLRYGESREDWQAKIDQTVDQTGLSEKRLKNIRAVGAIEKSRRRDSVEFGLHSELAGLAPEEQSYWLDKIESNGWDRRELREMIAAAARTKIVEGQAILEGQYRVLLVDCPWKYRDDAATEDGSLGKVSRHYPSMTIEQLCALPVKEHALPDSVMGFWVTAPLLLQNPGPREVIDAWGFTHKTQIIWDKVLGMPGRYGTHVQHELFLICTRGSCMPDVPVPQTKSIQTIRRSNVHSEKPEEFRQILDKHWPHGPRLELFARKRVDGWACFGNDARLWAEQAQGAPIKVSDDDIPF